MFPSVAHRPTIGRPEAAQCGLPETLSTVRGIGVKEAHTVRTAVGAKSGRLLASCLSNPSGKEPCSCLAVSEGHRDPAGTIVVSTRHMASGTHSRWTCHLPFPALSHDALRGIEQERPRSQRHLSTYETVSAEILKKLLVSAPPPTTMKWIFSSALFDVEACEVPRHTGLHKKGEAPYHSVHGWHGLFCV